MIRLDTTPEMRARIRELASKGVPDDYDRAVLMLLDDFAKCLAHIAPLEDFAGRHAEPPPGVPVERVN